MGTGVERTHVAVEGLRLAECGTNVGRTGQAVRALADPATLHLCG